MGKEYQGGGQELVGLCCLMTPDLSKDFQCHVLPLGKKIRSHHPGNPLGMYWKRIKPS